MRPGDESRVPWIILADRPERENPIIQILKNGEIKEPSCELNGVHGYELGGNRRPVETAELVGSAKHPHGEGRDLQQRGDRCKKPFKDAHSPMECELPPRVFSDPLMLPLLRRRNTLRETASPHGVDITLAGRASTEMGRNMEISRSILNTRRCISYKRNTPVILR